MAKQRRQLQLPILTDVKQGKKASTQLEGASALQDKSKTSSRSEAATGKDLEIYRSISGKYFK